MNVRKNILLIGLSFHLLWLHAHSTSEATDICCQDSAVHTDISETRIHIRPRENFKREFSYMGIPLIASGLIVKKKNEDFRTLRNRFEPTFHRRYDDYTQYVPLVAAWGLKLAGVESRSSWKELAVSNAFSAILMAGVVNSLKYTTHELRPDNSSDNSFPSGHTATAFMCATILHKEYGMKSPWYSIGGYTLAGLTGVTRQLNNRHWIGDVLVGAGVGILSTDLGYFFANLLFNEKERNKWELDIDYNRYDAPSFLGFNIGIASGPSTLRTAELYDSENGTPLGLQLKVGTATVVSVEGAYFFNPYIGIGGRLKVSTLPVIADIPERNRKGFDMDTDRKEGAPVNMFLLDGVESDHLGMFDMDWGIYLSYPLSRHFQLGSKLLIGQRMNANFSLNSVCHINPEIFDRNKVSQTAYEQFYKKDIEYYLRQEQCSQEELLHSSFIDTDFLTIHKSTAYKIGTGLSLTYRYKKDAAFRLYCDYDFASPRLSYELKNSWTDEKGERTSISYSRRTPMHNLTFGTSILFRY